MRLFNLSYLSLRLSPPNSHTERMKTETRIFNSSAASLLLPPPKFMHTGSMKIIVTDKTPTLCNKLTDLIGICLHIQSEATQVAKKMIITIKQNPWPHIIYNRDL